MVLSMKKGSAEMMDIDGNNCYDANIGYNEEDEDTSNNSWSILSLSSSSWPFPSIESENEQQKQLSIVSNLLSDLDSIGSLLSIEQLHDDDDDEDINIGDDDRTENDHKNQGDVQNRDTSESKKPVVFVMEIPVVNPIENRTPTEEEKQVKKRNGIPFSRNIAGLQIFYNGSLINIFSSSEGPTWTLREPRNRNQSFCARVQMFGNYLFMSVKSFLI